MVEIIFKYQNKNNKIKCHENELIKDICEKFKKKIN